MNQSLPGRESDRASTSLATFAGGFANFSTSRAAAIVALAAFTVVGVDHAQGATWNTDANGSWGTGSWTGGTPDAQNAVADFSTVNITADRTINLEIGRTVGDLKFGDATTPNFNWTLSSSNNSVLNIRKTGGGIATIDVVNQTATIGLVMTVTQNTTQINKLGAGTLILSGANTYGVTTTVSAGTLLANNTSGSATSTGAVSVIAGATLGGNGTIAPGSGNNISVSGVLAPGAAINTVGTLTFNMTNAGAVTMASGSSFAFNLGLAGTDITSVGSSDMIALTGAGLADLVFNGNTINFGGAGTNGYYKLFDTDFGSTTWSGLTVNGGGVITAGLTISNLAAGKTGTLLVGNGTNGGNAGDIYLSVVPEPSAALLAGLGSCLLFRRRRNPS